MTEILVQKTGDETYWVKVDASTTTTHTVNLDNSYFEKLTGGRVTPETLIEKSFEYLLERESNSMIMRRFGLPVIQTYFPEFENDIGERLKS